MAQEPVVKVENNFTKGLLTEFTGLNFPENAATDTSNCEYTLVGNVLRRQGIDFETNFTTSQINRTNCAVNTFKWNNVGGDGLTQVVVEQVGSKLYFYLSSSASTILPLSANKLSSVIDIAAFLAPGNTNNPAITECQFTDGNGYLFVFHPDCEPFYCTYAAGVITAAVISIQTRDFNGILEPGIADSTRLTTLSQEHLYNLTNQGWTAGGPWQANSTTSVFVATGPRTWIVPAGMSVTVGQHVQAYFTGIGSRGPNFVTMSGNVTNYTGTSLTVLVTSVDNYLQNQTLNSWNLIPNVNGYIDAWHAALSNYPSNSDVWWRFKDSTNVFNPGVTFSNVTLGTGPAPKGHHILNAFNQQRSLISSVSGLTDVVTTVRPRTGCWFQGRIWYAGVDAAQQATGDEPYNTWTENLYFSQTALNATQFGKCYQLNDPTSEDLFDLLPTDGGVITIQGCGSVYKLFPLLNALLIFAANGVWYLTGSQGVGFAANDYTIVKLSSIRSMSSTSFIDVNGLPMFWNEEGIYNVEPAKQGTGLLSSPLHVNPLEVVPLTIGTILTFYNTIPTDSKKFARGYYNPLDYVVQWIYRSTHETDVTSRYEFDGILNYNVSNKAFFPYTVTSTSISPKVNGIIYVASPGGVNAPTPVFKYITSYPSGNPTLPFNITFADEHDESFVDFKSFDGIGINYISYFITGFKLHGQGINKFQLEYLNMFSNSDVPTAYKVQGIWDFATDRNSGKFSSIQYINNNKPYVGVIFRRHRIRGRGTVLQLKVQSVDGLPFDIIGWAAYEQKNTGI